MRLNARLLASAVAVATCVLTAAAYYYQNRNREINEVMVFCKLQFNPYNYFDKLVSFIEGAKRSVNVCMPGIHNPAIQARLVNLIKTKNIRVQIVIDRSGYNESSDFFIKELVEAGAVIKCKANEPVFSMQHKFCLVDDEILMTGTLNWGNDRSYDHWNYVYITSKQQLVEPVRNEFYKMWNKASDLYTAFDIYCDSDTETVVIQDPEVISDESDQNPINMDTPLEKQIAQDEINSISMVHPSLEVD